MVVDLVVMCSISHLNSTVSKVCYWRYSLWIVGIVARYLMFVVVLTLLVVELGTLEQEVLQTNTVVEMKDV